MLRREIGVWSSDHHASHGKQHGPTERGTVDRRSIQRISFAKKKRNWHPNQTSDRVTNNKAGCECDDGQHQDAGWIDFEAPKVTASADNKKQNHKCHGSNRRGQQVGSP